MPHFTIQIAGGQAIITPADNLSFGEGYAAHLISAFEANRIAARELANGSLKVASGYPGGIMSLMIKVAREFQGVDLTSDSFTCTACLFTLRVEGWQVTVTSHHPDIDFGQPSQPSALAEHLMAAYPICGAIFSHVGGSRRSRSSRLARS